MAIVFMAIALQGSWQFGRRRLRRPGSCADARSRADLTLRARLHPFGLRSLTRLPGHRARRRQGTAPPLRPGRRLARDGGPEGVGTWEPRPVFIRPRALLGPRSNMGACAPVLAAAKRYIRFSLPAAARAKP